MLNMKESVDTFQSYLWKQPNIVSVKTVNQYVNTFSRLLKFVGGRTANITTKEIRDFVQGQSSRSAVRQLRTVITYAQVVFPEIETLNETDWSNLHNRKRKRVTKRLPFSSKAMLTRIYNVDHEVAQVMMLLSLHTGCRMGALANFTKSDYDRELKQMTLTEKGNKRITYQLNEFTLVDRLEKIMDESPNEKPLLAMRTIQSYCEAIELQSHDFRRLYSKKVQDAFIEDGYSDNKALELTKEAMNHENVDTTYGYANYDSIDLTKRRGKKDED